MDEDIERLLNKTVEAADPGGTKAPEIPEREDTETDFVDDPEFEGLPTELIPSTASDTGNEKSDV